MREKIAQWLLENINQGCGFKDRTFGQAADQILTLISEETEKGLLTDEEIGNVLAEEFRRVSGRNAGRYFHDISPNDRVIAQAQVKKSLALLK